MDQLGFVEAVDGFGQGVVVAVADATDGGLDAGIGQALGVFYGNVLHTAIRVMHEPADNAPGEGVDDK